MLSEYDDCIDEDLEMIEDFIIYEELTTGGISCLMVAIIAVITTIFLQ
jgi:hypothetical protein